jgi:hypothetical protein
MLNNLLKQKDIFTHVISFIQINDISNLVLVSKDINNFINKNKLSILMEMFIKIKITYYTRKNTMANIHSFTHNKIKNGIYCDDNFVRSMNQYIIMYPYKMKDTSYDLNRSYYNSANNSSSKSNRSKGCTVQ